MVVLAAAGSPLSFSSSVSLLQFSLFASLLAPLSVALSLIWWILMGVILVCSCLFSLPFAPRSLLSRLDFQLPALYSLAVLGAAFVFAFCEASWCRVPAFAGARSLFRAFYPCCQTPTSLGCVGAFPEDIRAIVNLRFFAGCIFCCLLLSTGGAGVLPVIVVYARCCAVFGCRPFPCRDSLTSTCNGSIFALTILYGCAYSCHAREWYSPLLSLFLSF